MRDKLLTDKTVVLTSATLMLGGDFSADRDLCRAASPTSGSTRPVPRRPAADATGGAGALPWVGLDVGSPFDYGQQAILYVARHLPPPGRDGLGEAQLDEIVVAGRRRRRAARSGCSAHAARPRRRPRRSASGCPT